MTTGPLAQSEQREGSLLSQKDNRDGTRGAVRCHDAQLFVEEIIQGMDPTFDNRHTRRTPARRSGAPFPSDDSPDEATTLPPLHRPTAYRSRNITTRSQKTRDSETHRRMVEAQRALREREFKEEMEKVRLSVERIKNQKEKAREEKFLRDYNEIARERQTFVDEHINRIVATKHISDDRRRRKLYEEWTKSVYEPLQSEISRKIEAMDVDELNQRRRNIYEKYLHEVNRRPHGVFRDIVIESEYDPFEYNRPQYKIHYNSTLQDPTKKFQLRHSHEQDVKKSMSHLLSRQASRMPIVARAQDMNEAERDPLEDVLHDGDQDRAGYRTDVLDVRLWDVVQDTNYGHFAKVFNTSRQTALPGNARSKTLASNVVLDHFDYPTSSKAVKAEEPRGKRIGGPRITKSTAELLSGFEPPELAQKFPNHRTRNKKPVDSQASRSVVNLFEEPQTKVRTPRPNRPRASLTHLRGGVLLAEPVE